MRNCISKFASTLIVALVAPSCIASGTTLSTLADSGGTAFPPDVRSPGAGVDFATTFYTGPGRYQLNAVVLEQMLPLDPSSKLQVRILSATFNDWGIEVAPVADLVLTGVLDDSTEYPQFTKYVRYAPQTDAFLAPHASYLICAGEPADGATDASLVYTQEPLYVSDAGWQLGPDLIGFLFGSDEIWMSSFSPGHFKFALDTTTVAPPNSPPDVTQAQASVTELWPPNGQFVPITITGVTDPDGDPVSIVVTAVEQDEPLTTVGKRLQIDAIIDGNGGVQLRAARLGNGDGRVYRITFTASDGKPDGVTEGQVYVTVPHDMGIVAGDNGLTNAYFNSLGR